MISSFSCVGCTSDKGTFMEFFSRSQSMEIKTFVCSEINHNFNFFVTRIRCRININLYFLFPRHTRQWELIALIIVIAMGSARHKSENNNFGRIMKICLKLLKRRLTSTWLRGHVNKSHFLLQCLVIANFVVSSVDHQQQTDASLY